MPACSKLTTLSTPQPAKVRRGDHILTDESAQRGQKQYAFNYVLDDVLALVSRMLVFSTATTQCTGHYRYSV
jgi:hypothetical protein